MEVDVGPPIDNVLGVIGAAQRGAVAQIKQETAETGLNLVNTETNSHCPNQGDKSMYLVSTTASSDGTNFAQKPPNLSMPFQSRTSVIDSYEVPTSVGLFEMPQIPLYTETSTTDSQARTTSLNQQCPTDSSEVFSMSVKVNNKNGFLERVPNSLENTPLTKVIKEHVPSTVKQVIRKSLRSERVEKTTRRLRARQNTAEQHNSYKEKTASFEAKLSDHGCSSSQKSEIIFPPEKELRPRRLTRKPHHTQRFWRLDIVGDALDRWQEVGRTQGLGSDTEIAVFLMQHYENVMSGQPTGAICVNCNTLLTFTCIVCHTPSQLVEVSKSSHTSPNHYSTDVPPFPTQQNEDEEMVAKVEPEDVPDDAEPDSELQLLVIQPEEGTEEEEKKKKSGRRKRGRPIGSGKKMGGSGIPKSKLKMHKYKCTYDGCGAAFGKSSRLKIHTRIHTGEKPYICKECNRAFTQNSGLKVHMQKHSGLRPFSCKECGSTFPSSSTLKQHMRRHTGEKPFQCKKCDKTFRWSGHLTQHMRMHDGIKPFLCQVCGKSFSASSDLVKHKVTHTKDRPYQCNLCDKAYSFQHRLTAHKRSHTGDRPFLCSLCGAAFARAHNLTVHMRTHTGDKPYWCQDCGAKFSDSGNFSKHKKTKHGDAAKKTFSVKGKGSGPVKLSKSSSKLGYASSVDISGLSDFGQVSDITKPRLGLDRLPSMTKVVNAAKLAVKNKLLKDGQTLSPDTSQSLCGLITSNILTHRKASSPSDIADFKSLLSPAGSEQPVCAGSQHLGGSIHVGSPPIHLVHNQMTVSPVMSPAVSLPPQPSPVHSSSNDSRISPLPQPAHQIQDYPVTQNDGAVFPPSYYGNYPYYYQQQ